MMEIRSEDIHALLEKIMATRDRNSLPCQLWSRPSTQALLKAHELGEASRFDVATCSFALGCVMMQEELELRKLEAKL